MFSQTVSHDREEQPLERLRDFPSTGATILPLSDASPITPGHSVLLASIRVTSRILAIGCSLFGLPGGKSCNSQSPFRSSRWQRAKVLQRVSSKRERRLATSLIGSLKSASNSSIIWQHPHAKQAKASPVIVLWASSRCLGEQLHSDGIAFAFSQMQVAVASSFGNSGTSKILRALIGLLVAWRALGSFRVVTSGFVLRQ